MKALETVNVPLGAREGQHLELKGAEALREKSLWSIAREVVAMLNADGGEVWVGLAEDRGVAVRVEPIAQVDFQVSRLLDHLVDIIDPALVHDEVRVEAIGRVIRVTVKPHPEHRPYDLKGKGGAVHFPVRVGDRVRPMTREEQRRAFSQEPQDQSRLQKAIESMLAEREELQNRDQEFLSLRLRSVPEVSLKGREDDLVEMLMDPEATGNRRSGWTLAAPSWPHPEKTATGGVRSEWPDKNLFESDAWRRVEILSTGAVLYEAGLERFSFHDAHGGKRPTESAPELWPLGLADLPVSVMRLAAKLFDGCLTTDDWVVGDLSLFGLHGWKLRPGSPRFIRSQVIWDFHEGRPFEGQDLLLPEPLVFKWPELKQNPDRCAYRLLRLIYREFGFDEDALPRDLFDPRTGRFLLTD